MRNSVLAGVATAVTAASLALGSASLAAAHAFRPSSGGGIARGSITVTSFSSQTVATSPDGTKFQDNTLGQVYRGGITGTGPLVSAEIVHPDGTATFVGSEFITCALAGRSGTLLLTDVGTVDGTVVRGTWTIAGGLGGLAGIAGTGSFVATLGQGATYVLRFHFAG